MFRVGYKRQPFSPNYFNGVLVLCSVLAISDSHFHPTISMEFLVLCSVSAITNSHIHPNILRDLLALAYFNFLSLIIFINFLALRRGADLLATIFTKLHGGSTLLPKEDLDRYSRLNIK